MARSGKRQDGSEREQHVRGSSEVDDLLGGVEREREEPVGGWGTVGMAGAGETEPGIDKGYQEALSPAEEKWLEGMVDRELTYAEELVWVGRHLDRRKLLCAEVPSRRAFSLLKWARRNRNAFFGKLLPDAEKVVREMGREVAAAGEVVSDDLERMSREDLESMLVEAVQESVHVRVTGSGRVELPRAAVKGGRR